MAHQNFFGLEPVIKKVSNIFVVWKPRDRDEIGRIKNQFGLEKGELPEIFDAVTSDEHDCICVDHTKASPAYPHQNRRGLLVFIRVKWHTQRLLQRGAAV